MSRTRSIALLALAITAMVMMALAVDQRGRPEQSRDERVSKRLDARTGRGAHPLLSGPTAILERAVVGASGGDAIVPPEVAARAPVQLATRRPSRRPPQAPRSTLASTHRARAPPLG